MCNVCALIGPAFKAVVYSIHTHEMTGKNFPISGAIFTRRQQHWLRNRLLEHIGQTEKAEPENSEEGARGKGSL